MIFRKLLLIVVLAATLTIGCSAPTAPATDTYAPEISPADFTTTIDNPYMPLVPGTTYISEGPADGEIEHIKVSVLHETKTVMGVECIVVRDTVTVDGEVIEDTWDWYAQDAEGNVWYFGEDSRTYENGEQVSTEGSWEAGVDGAMPGIVMKADPQVGDTYRQEYYAGEAEDMADVLSISENVTVAYGAFENVVMTKDYTPLDPDVVEFKFYAPGIGFILETMEGSDERVELIDIIVEQ
jgi:hypothetical protein